MISPQGPQSVFVDGVGVEIVTKSGSECDSRSKEKCVAEKQVFFLCGVGARLARIRSKPRRVVSRRIAYLSYAQRRSARLSLLWCSRSFDMALEKRVRRADDVVRSRLAISRHSMSNSSR